MLIIPQISFFAYNKIMNNAQVAVLGGGDAAEGKAKNRGEFP